MKKLITIPLLSAFTLLGSFSLNSVAQVQSADINLTEHSVQVSGNFDSPWENIYQHASVIYSDDIKYDEDGYGVFYGLYSGYKGDEISASLGGKLLYVDSDIEDGGALALGGELRWYFYSKVSLRLMGHFAPSILSFGDMDEYRELGAHVVFEVFPNTEVYVGAKDTRAEFEYIRGKSELQHGFNVGLQVNL